MFALEDVFFINAFQLKKDHLTLDQAYFSVYSLCHAMIRRPCIQMKRAGIHKKYQTVLKTDQNLILEIFFYK